MRKNIRLILILGLIIINWEFIYAQKLNPELVELINNGINKSHEKKINLFTIQQVQLDKKRLWENYIPELSLTASYSRLNDDIILNDNLEKLLMGTQALLIKEAYGIPFNAALPPQIHLNPIPPIQDKDILKSSLDLQSLIFSGFKIKTAYKSLDHKQKAMEYLQLSKDENLVREIIQKYYQLALLSSTNNVLNTTEEFLDKQSEYVVKAKKNGLAIDLDLQKIALAQQKLKIKKLEVKQKKQLLLSALSQTTGLSVEELKKLNYNIQFFVLRTSKINNAERNELKALKEKIKAYDYKKKMELTSYMPKIMAKAHYELLEDDLTILDPKWYIGVGLKWNIFDGFKAYNRAQKSQLEIDKTLEKFKQAKEMISLEKQQAKYKYETSIKKIDLSNQQVKLARYTYDLTKKQYLNGLVSITDLLKSITDLEIAKLKYQQALYEENINAINYLKSNGNLLKLIKN